MPVQKSITAAPNRGEQDAISTKADAENAREVKEPEREVILTFFREELF